MREKGSCGLDGWRPASGLADAGRARRSGVEREFRSIVARPSEAIKVKL